MTENHLLVAAVLFGYLVSAAIFNRGKKSWNYIDLFHGRPLQLYFNGNSSLFEEILEKCKSVSVHVDAFFRLH